MNADERDDWDWKYDNWKEREMIREMETEERLKARKTFETMVKRLQLALDEQAELKRHRLSIEKGLFELKMKRAELCVSSARKACQVAKDHFERLNR